VLVVRNACTDFGHDWLTVTTPPAPAAPGQAACRTALANELTTLRQRTIELLGSTARCRRPKAGAAVDRAAKAARRSCARAAERHIAQACGPVYDDLGLPPLDDVVATALERAAPLRAGRLSAERPRPDVRSGRSPWACGRSSSSIRRARASPARARGP
jgi:hypothetical protein